MINQILYSFHSAPSVRLHFGNEEKEKVALATRRMAEGAAVLPIETWLARSTTLRDLVSFISCLFWRTDSDRCCSKVLRKTGQGPGVSANQ